VTLDLSLATYSFVPYDALNVSLAEKCLDQSGKRKFLMKAGIKANYMK
jgi:hypothetical protein